MKTLLFTCLFFAQTPATVRLHDGSLLKVQVVQEALEVDTRYGKLTIPVGELRHVEIGSHFPEGQEEVVQAHLKALGAENPKTRESATKGVLAAGTAAFPLVVPLAGATDLEVKARAAKILRVMQETYPAERLKSSRDDVIEAEGLRVTGKIAGTGLKVRSATLGEMTCAFASMVDLRIQATGNGEIVLDAARDDWRDTGLTLDRTSRLTITASGQVDLWPQGAGQYVANPKGYTTPGKGGMFPAGALIGRLGEGKAFMVGERYEGTPGAGRLYLQIVGSPWNNPSAGTYSAKASVE